MKKFFILILLFPTIVNGITTSAKSAILMDMDTGQILYKKNINEQRSVASISKIMTAIIALQSNIINKEVVVGEEIKNAYGSSIYLNIGEKIKLKDLVYGLMLRSGNELA